MKSLRSVLQVACQPQTINFISTRQEKVDVAFVLKEGAERGRENPGGKEGELEMVAGF